MVMLISHYFQFNAHKFGSSCQNFKFQAAVLSVSVPGIFVLRVWACLFRMEQRVSQNSASLQVKNRCSKEFPFAFAGTTILEAIKEAVGKETEVIHEVHPSEATFADKEFSYAIVVVGEPPYAEFLGDRTELEIPLNGAETISLVANEEVPTLVIAVSGRPLVFEPNLLEKIDALVAAWLPGSEGGGIADVLFGDHQFEGVLPVTWFRSVDHLPINAGHDPLFPLGFIWAENEHR